MATVALGRQDAVQPFSAYATWSCHLRSQTLACVAWIELFHVDLEGCVFQLSQVR